MRRVARYLAEFKGSLAAAFGLSFAASVAFALLPWPIRYMIAGPLLDGEPDRLGRALRLSAAYLGLQALAALLMSASFFVFARTALLMIHTLRGRMLVHLRKLSLGFHTDRSTGDLIFRSINDARAIQEVVIFGLQAWAMPVFQITLMVVLMASLDVVLTLVALGVAPFLIFTIRRLTGRIQRASAQSRTHMGELTAHIEQTMGSMRAVQVFGREAAERERFEETSHRFIRAQLRFRLSEQALSVSTMLLTGLATAVVLLVASDRVIDGVVTVGTLWIFLSYLQRIYELLQNNMSLYGLLQDSIVGVGRAFDVLETEPSIVDPPDAVPLRALEREIELRGVSLDYGGGPVLTGIDLTVLRGQTVALVGETGSGKTSILNLIPRLHDATDGAVRIDGVDVRSLELRTLRDQVSLLPQEPLLFDSSIGDNIRYGRLDATDEEVRAAAAAARIDTFIDGLPDGYDTSAGVRGGKLSIGQQQRIALARAFLKDAPILLLDEPTSALDLRTESELLASLRDLMAGRTVVIVAHRLSTIREADQICVVDHGTIIETGTHQSLLERKGAYAALAARS